MMGFCLPAKRQKRRKHCLVNCILVITANVSISSKKSNNHPPKPQKPTPITKQKVKTIQFSFARVAKPIYPAKGAAWHK
jgi:hypothetical protein